MFSGYAELRQDDRVCRDRDTTILDFSAGLSICSMGVLVVIGDGNFIFEAIRKLGLSSKCGKS